LSAICLIWCLRVLLFMYAFATMVFYFCL